MNKAYWKNIVRTIWQSKGRYLAIMAIIALGVGFFSGLKVTKPGMVQTGNEYMRKYSLYDFRLLSTYGFDDTDVEALAAADHVMTAAGSYYEDFIYVNESEGEYILKAYSITDGVNELELCAGRMPEASNECVVDAKQLGDSDLLGKQIIVDESNDEEIKDSFRYSSYTVVGMVNSPMYINIERGTASIGNGRVNGFIYIPEDGFEFEYYKEVYLKCQNSYDIYTDEYDTYIDEITPDIEASLDETAQNHYQRLLDEIDRSYDEAVADARKEVEEQVRVEVTEQVTQEFYAQCAVQGLSTETVNEMLAEGTLVLPQDTIEELTEEMTDSAMEEALADIEKPTLDEPETYLLDRSANTGYMCYDSDTGIVNGVARVFPIFFFLIAALVCSTTMTRMVDDERGQIGTYRALGYSNTAIIAKYMIYSGSSALIGCVGGFFGGCYLFPYVIAGAYRMLYDFGDGISFYFSPVLLIICIAVSLLCSVGMTYLACKNELRCMPAELIRPKAPAAGKRIFLERISFIWRKMKFLHKVTARNVFRFKKRMFMMILGIAGCTALVLTGLGVRDSITNLAEFQYDDIDIHDVEVTTKNSISEEVRGQLIETAGDALTGSAELYKTSVEFHLDDSVKTVYLIAADGGTLKDFVNFNMESGADSYPGYGEVMISEKIAELSGLSVGDEITLTDADDGEVSLVISGVFRNYVWHYAYVTPETYEDYFGKAFEPNTVYVNVADEQTAYEMSARLKKLDSVMNVTVVSEVKDRVSNMMKMMNAVVALIICCAGALAFIVLFNLSNINITERVREIATIKVLGFYAGETGAYVFRENMVLTLIGIVAGLPLGVWLHRFVMSRIQVDMVAFAVEIMPISFVYTVLIVLLFFIVVDLVMRPRIEAIDMAESLKSIE